MANIRTVFLGYQDFTEEINAELSIQFKRKEDFNDLTSFKKNRIELSLKNLDPNIIRDEIEINIDLKTAIKLSKVLRIEISKLMEVENG